MVSSAPAKSLPIPTSPIDLFIVCSWPGLPGTSRNEEEWTLAKPPSPAWQGGGSPASTWTGSLWAPQTVRSQFPRRPCWPPVFPTEAGCKRGLPSPPGFLAHFPAARLTWETPSHAVQQRVNKPVSVDRAWSPALPGEHRNNPRNTAAKRGSAAFLHLNQTYTESRARCHGNAPVSTLAAHLLAVRNEKI